MVNLLEDVLRSGTGAGVRARGLTVPAAGKTRTSHDGWFVGFTSDLLCVVWVGFDDNRDLKLEGAKSALPIWTEFMKQAVALMGRPKSFQPPTGIMTAQVDPAVGKTRMPRSTVRDTHHWYRASRVLQPAQQSLSRHDSLGTVGRTSGAPKPTITS